MFKGLFKFFIDLIMICVAIVLIFSARGVYGKFFPNEKDKQRLTQTTTNTNSNNNNSNNNATENKKVENTNKTKLTKEQLDSKFYELMTKYKNEKNEVSFVYDNLKTGYRYAYNDNKVYTAASTTKVIYALYYYDLVRDGKIKLDTPIKYNKSNFEDGNGKITNDVDKKESYPLTDVLQNMLTYSDNTATKMLTNNYKNIKNIRENVYKKIGISSAEKNSDDNLVTPQAMEKVWLYLYKNKDKYQDMFKFLKEGETYSTGSIEDKEIASKYGAIGNFNHENAIVFGNEDYLVIIFTNNMAHAKDTINKMFKDIDDITENRN